MRGKKVSSVVEKKASCIKNYYEEENLLAWDTIRQRDQHKRSQERTPPL